MKPKSKSLNKVLFSIIIASCLLSLAANSMGEQLGFEPAVAMYKHNSKSIQLFAQDHLHNALFAKFWYDSSNGRGYMSLYEQVDPPRTLTSDEYIGTDVSKIQKLLSGFRKKFEHGDGYFGNYSYPSSALTPTKRKLIIGTGSELRNSDVGYTWVDMIDPKNNQSCSWWPYPKWCEKWTGKINNIDEMRCDAMTEYSYEKHGILVSRKYWNITYPGNDYVYEHNDFHNHAYNFGELCPRIQSGELGNDSYFDPAVVRAPGIKNLTVKAVDQNRLQIGMQLSDNASWKVYVMVRAHTDDHWQVIRDATDKDWRFLGVDLTYEDHAVGNLDGLFIDWKDGLLAGGDILDNLHTVRLEVTVIDQGANYTVKEYSPPNLLTINKAGAGTGTVTSYPAGIDCGIDCTEMTEMYHEDTVVTLSAIPYADSIFTGWTGGGCDGSTEDTCKVTMDSDKTVTATFKSLHLLRVNRAGTGTVRSKDGYINCGTDCSESYVADTKVTLSATSDPGFVFTGWTGGGCDGSTEDTCKVTMDSDKTVTATFKSLHLLRVNRAGTGTGTVRSEDGYINCGTDCSKPYVADTKVTLSATPDPGSVFSGWSGDCPRTNQQTTVIMNADKRCTATFSPPNPVAFYYEAVVPPHMPIWWQGQNLREDPRVGDNPYWLSGKFGWDTASADGDIWLSRVGGFPIFEPEDLWYQGVTILDNIEDDDWMRYVDVAEIDAYFGPSQVDLLGWLDLDLKYSDDAWSSSSLPMYLSMDGLLAGQIKIGTFDSRNYVHAEIMNLQTIPEPATIVLLGSSILILAGLRKLRRTAK